MEVYFGNFVSDNKTILRKINKTYYLSISSNPNSISSNDLTVLNFKTQFPEDLKLLTNPTKESEFIIEGVLLDSFDNELELLKGLFVSVEYSLTFDRRSAALRAEIPQFLPSAAALKEQYTNFQIIITKKMKKILILNHFLKNLKKELNMI